MAVIPESRLARWVRQNVELTSLALLVMTVLCVWAFAELADEVLESSTRSAGP